MQSATLALLLAVVLAGCAASGPPLQADAFSNTVWREVCPGESAEVLYLRFLPDGSFAWSEAEPGPTAFQHDGDDRWAVVENTLVVTWENDLEQTVYRFREGVDTMVGNSTRACGREARLERVQ